VLNLDCTYYEIIHKQIDNVGLKYHIDDCIIVTKNTIPKYNNSRYIHISGNKYLYFNNIFNRLPKKTILFYQSSWNIDFTGGILRFADLTEIKPKINTGIVFDSREVPYLFNLKVNLKIK
jgi:hypothetical protein